MIEKKRKLGFKIKLKCCPSPKAIDLLVHIITTDGISVGKMTFSCDMNNDGQKSVSFDITKDELKELRNGLTSLMELWESTRGQNISVEPLPDEVV